MLMSYISDPIHNVEFVHCSASADSTISMNSGVKQSNISFPVVAYIIENLLSMKLLINQPRHKTYGSSSVSWQE